MMNGFIRSAYVPVGTIRYVLKLRVPTVLFERPEPSYVTAMVDGRPQGYTKSSSDAAVFTRDQLLTALGDIVRDETHEAIRCDTTDRNPLVLALRDLAQV